MRTWLFHVHVLADLAGLDGGQGMPVMGPHNRRDVDVLAIIDAPQIGLDRHLSFVSLFEFLRNSFDRDRSC
ncbi:MAG: hypothetical protein AAF961_05625 [Planctomycetota bacterium]